MKKKRNQDRPGQPSKRPRQGKDRELLSGAEDEESRPTGRGNLPPRGRGKGEDGEPLSGAEDEELSHAVATSQEDEDEDGDPLPRAELAEDGNQDHWAVDSWEAEEHWAEDGESRPPGRRE